MVNTQVKHLGTNHFFESRRKPYMDAILATNKKPANPLARTAGLYVPLANLQEGDLSLLTDEQTGQVVNRTSQAQGFLARNLAHGLVGLRINNLYHCFTARRVNVNTQISTHGRDKGLNLCGSSLNSIAANLCGLVNTGHIRRARIGNHFACNLSSRWSLAPGFRHHGHRGAASDLRHRALRGHTNTGCATHGFLPEKSGKPSSELLQQGQHDVGLGISLREHRGGGLLKNLRLGQPAVSLA